MPGLLSGEIARRSTLSTGGSMYSTDGASCWAASRCHPTRFRSRSPSTSPAPRSRRSWPSWSFVLRDHSPPADSCSRPPSVSLAQLGSSYFGDAPDPSQVADFKPGYLDQHADQDRAGADRRAAAGRARTRRRVDPLLPPHARSHRSRHLARCGAAGSADEAGDRTCRRGSDRHDGAEPGHPGRGAGDLRPRKRIEPPGSTVRRSAGRTRPGHRRDGRRAPRSRFREGPPSRRSPNWGSPETSRFSAVRPSTSASMRLRSPSDAIEQAKLHLVAHYTPVAGGEASAVDAIRQHRVATRRLDDSGMLDITGTIPAGGDSSNVGVAVATAISAKPAMRAAQRPDAIHPRSHFDDDRQPGAATTGADFRCCPWRSRPRSTSRSTSPTISD